MAPKKPTSSGSAPSGATRNWSAEQRREAFLKARAEFKGDYRLIEADFKENFVPYNHIVFDNVLKLGGIARGGRVTQIHGDEGTGKSTAILSMAAQYQQQTGEPVAVFDFEGTGTVDYNTKLGLDPDMMFFRKPDSIDTAMADVMKMLDAGVRFFVFDSIPYMEQKVDKKDIINGKVFKSNYGGHAKAIATFYKTLAPWMKEKDAAMYMVNQTRDRIDDSPEAKYASQYSYTNRIYTLPGGRMGRFAPATMLELTLQKELRPWDWKSMPTDKEDFLLIQPAGDYAKNFPTANKVRVRSLKNKVTGGGFREGVIYIRPGFGLDEKMSLRDLACTYDLVGYAGKWFIGNSKEDNIALYDNKKELIEDFVVRENPAVYEKLRPMIIDRIEKDDTGRFNTTLSKEEIEALSESHISAEEGEDGEVKPNVHAKKVSRKAFEVEEDEL